jgi:hypothetical protein
LRCKTKPLRVMATARYNHNPQSDVKLSAHSVRNMHQYCTMYSCVSTQCSEHAPILHCAQLCQHTMLRTCSLLRIYTHISYQTFTFPTKLTKRISNYTGINSSNVYYFYLFIYLLAVYVTPPSLGRICCEANEAQTSGPLK